MKKIPPQKILIHGAGSVGTYLGAKLHRAGHDVTLLGRKKLNNLGNQVTINGEKFELPHKTDQLSAQENYDAVFVATKSRDVRSTITDLKKKEIKSRMFAFVQNGLHEKDFYGEIKNHPGLVRIGIFEGMRLAGSELYTTKSKLGWQIEDTPASRELCELIICTGINAIINPRFMKIMAEKMIFACAVHALSAVRNKKFGELLDDEATKKQMLELAWESYAVLRNDFGLGDFEKIKMMVLKTAEQNGQHFSSVHQDLSAGKETEIDFLNGKIVKLGRENKVATPANKQIFEEIKKLESILAKKQSLIKHFYAKGAY